MISNHEITVDLDCMESRPVLYVVNTHTRFQGGNGLRSKYAEVIWSAFMELWITIYVGYPCIRRVEQESAIA